MQEITMSDVDFDCKTVVIVMFGPASAVSGFRPAEYYQVTIDPSRVSKSGKYIRFGSHPGDELVGWQRVDALTVVEVLSEWDGDEPPNMTIGVNGVTMRAIE